ncbi:O-antigen ligase family protein [Pseudonocardia bannensis]|uniref:O-antigen ligase family protein n=1 Tax=Pseudonocardia bannensis TaxID=630973 RepID=A0A848DC06_9PSEU|nr:O-antigen ligase family protein [Pseudonocardia bannensis]NMH90111.1 O-antigen ligase family protein [Pseudonocardia bannensis]
MSSPTVTTTFRHRVIVLGLGTALGYGALAQGAFYTEQFGNVLLLVAVAAGVRALSRPRRTERFVVVCAGSWTLFAAWALTSASMHGDVRAGLPMAALGCCLAAAVWAASGLPERARHVLEVVILGTAVVVAASAWVGVALHLEPLALPSDGLWRAASTLTYANAAASFLVTGVLVAVAVLPPHRRMLSLAVVSILLLALLATMSRAGVLGLAVGTLAHVTTRSGRARLARLWPVLPAVAVAFAGLLPSLPAESDADPILALAGLAGGIALLAMHRHPRLLGLAVTGIAMGLTALSFGSPATVEAVTGIASTRLSTTSDDRDDLTRVTAEQFWSSPVSGVGPGRLDLEYVNHQGVPVRAEYTHNEYLQLATETGLVGVVLAVAGSAALAVGAFRRRNPSAAELARPAALAVVAAFCVHSAFDFLWHIPVLPLLTALSVVVLLATAGPASRPTVPEASS